MELDNFFIENFMQTKIESIFSGVHGWITVLALIAGIIQVIIPFLNPQVAGVLGTIVAAVLLYTHPQTPSTPSIQP